MTAFLLLVTWLAYGQPPDHYQVPFSSNEACEAARLMGPRTPKVLIKELDLV